MTEERGQILVVVIAALGVVLFSVLFIIAGAQVYFQNSTYTLNSEKAIALAEAGLDKAIASINKTGGSYNGETETVLAGGSYSVAITTKDAVTKIIQATGYIPNKSNPKVKKTISIQASKGVGIAFNYGLQVGQAGLTMGNSTTLNGSVYSNGNIVGGNNMVITGTVNVAGGTQQTADQQSDCSGANCQDYIFGKSVAGEDRQDVAQSFKPSSTAVINKVSVKLKKTGSPANPTVRIMQDSGGKPDKTQVLASGTLSASLVSGSYSFVDVSFSQSPTLNANTTYWIMIHASSLNNSNYWYWSNDLAQGYTGGSPKWSSNWQAGNAVWTDISGDLGFKTYMGGVVTSITGGNNAQVSGDVHANTINNLTINGNAYYQVINNSTVSGTSYPGSADLPPTVFPVSEANITDWKNEAEAQGVTEGSLSYGNNCTASLGPRKITGSVSFGNECTVTIKSPLWIGGALSAGNTTIFKLDSSYEGSSGVIVVDGPVSTGNWFDLKGSGTAGSYLMLLSTYSGTAVSIGDSSIVGIVYASAGTVNFQNGVTIKEVVASGINMGNTAKLNYETGLANAFFTSGPTGGYTLVKGTYQVK